MTREKAIEVKRKRNAWVGCSFVGTAVCLGLWGSEAFAVAVLATAVAWMMAAVYTLLRPLPM